MSAAQHYPASYAQRALWVLAQMLPNDAVYNEPNGFRIKGTLDLEALTRALNEIVRRHEALRTCFRLVDGEPVQEIVSELSLGVEITDLSSLPDAERETEAQRHAGEEARARFDMQSGPLIRVRLLRMAKSEHWLLITRHHIVRDGQSDVIFAKELSALYRAYRSGEVSPLPEVATQYGTYAARQREQLRGPLLEEQLRYWKEALADLPMLDLATDRRRPPVASYRGARVAFELREELVRALRALARNCQTTLFTALLAALQVLLARYSGQEDVAVGVPVAGRNAPELKGLIGYFVNLLVLRGDLSGDPTFKEFLARTRQRTREAYAHQDLPFAKLVEELAPERDLSRNPLFQVSLVKATEVDERPDLEDLMVQTIETKGTETVKFDLHFSVAEHHGKIAVAIEYATDLFYAATIEQMAKQWRTLLEDIVANPDRSISRLKLLDEHARRQIILDGDATLVGHATDGSIAGLFAAQVTCTPDGIAIVDGDRSLSYAALDRQSRALAHKLREAGVSPGGRIGVCIERSLDGVVAMLGVLKAGCAYVPIDPTHPAERVAALLQDAEAAAVVTVSRALQSLSIARTERTCPVVVVDAAGAINEVASVDPPLTTHGEDPACVLYTSGSTGSPKGVVIPQRAVLRLVLGTDYIRFGADDVVAHLSNPAFDAATLEIWGALLNGARLAVISRDAVLSPEVLAAALDHHRVTTFFLTTSLFHQVARVAPRAFKNRQVLFGGEAAEPRWVAAALRDGQPRRLLNGYGPTEATTFATWHEVREVDADAITVPIGRPLASTEVYVLDEHREPVPPGIPGEIWIGGPRLALGYLNAPQLTAERFIPHPFKSALDAKLYRTGDRARRRDDGTIEFLGRFDNQIKIRGHRIEPGEVEAALLRLPELREAVVLAHGATSDTRRLNAYVVAAEGKSPTAAELWVELRRTLPEYLVPHGIVLLAALPLTPNGKIDRRALPDPVDLTERSAPSRLKPRSFTEHTLAVIWERLLGLRRVGVRESFFDLGGHSLLAAQMVEEIGRAFGMRLPVTTLFTASTIEHLAAIIRSGAPAPTSLVALNTAGSRPPLFFFHGDYRDGGLYCRGLASGLGPMQPFYVVHPHGLDGGDVPSTIEEMAADRVAALRRERPGGPYFLGGHCNGALVAVEMARQLIEADETVPLVVVLDGVARAAFVEFSAGAPAGANGAAEKAPMGLLERYRDAVKRYVPKPFPGRIAVLRSGAMRDARPDLGWQAIAKEVGLHSIPGGHLASLTRHIGATAACIKACLDDAWQPTAAD